MLNPRCTCSITRFRTLGVPFTTSPCSLTNMRERRSFKEISIELGVQELDEALLYALVRLAGMVITDGAFLHSPVCCIAPSIQTIDDIVHAATLLSPFPYKLSDDRFLNLLKKKNNLIVISPLVFLRTGNESVSDDLKKLWQTSLETDNRYSLESSLLHNGLQPTAVRSVFVPPRKRPAPAPKKFKWNSLLLKHPS